MTISSGWSERTKITIQIVLKCHTEFIHSQAHQAIANKKKWFAKNNKNSWESWQIKYSLSFFFVFVHLRNSMTKWAARFCHSKSPKYKRFLRRVIEMHIKMVMTWMRSTSTESLEARKKLICIGDWLNRQSTPVVCDCMNKNSRFKIRANEFPDFD